MLNSIQIKHVVIIISSYSSCSYPIIPFSTFSSLLVNERIIIGIFIAIVVVIVIVVIAVDCDIIIGSTLCCCGRESFVG